MKSNSQKRNSTETSPFGTAGRINHDATRFYSSRLYEGLPGEQEVNSKENPIPPKRIDQLYCKSSESMDELPDNSIHLMVTSPP